MSLLTKFSSELSHHRKLQLWAVIFILPAVIFLVGFLVIPIVISARMSLFQYNLVNQRQTFIGFENYAFSLTDPNFLNSLEVTGKMILMKVPLQIVLSLGVAMLVNRRFFGVGIVRSLPLMATVMPMSIAAVLWRMMYHPSNGIINSLIRLLGLAPLSFLRDPEIALPAVTGMMLWKDLGFYMIIFLAGLQGIDQEYYEAAMVDGATALQKFWYITLPMLRRTITVVLIVSTTFAFQMFIPAYVMTDGGPQGATDVIVFYIYRMGFRFFRMGYANALTIILLVIVIILMAFQYWLSSRED